MKNLKMYEQHVPYQPPQEKDYTDEILDILIQYTQFPKLYTENYYAWESLATSMSWEDYKEAVEDGVSDDPLMDEKEYNEYEKKIESHPTDSHLMYLIRNFNVGDGEPEHHIGEENRSIKYFIESYGVPTGVARIIKDLIKYDGRLPNGFSAFQ